MAKGGRAKPMYRRGLSWLVALFAYLLLIEIVARLYGFGRPLIYRPSPAGYEFVPSQKVVRFSKTSTVNRFGMRGPDIQPVPAEGVIRIMSLGDSVANGTSMVNDDQTYPARLQSYLRNKGQSVEVLNAGVGGWALANEAKWLRTNGLFSAHYLLLEVNQTDLGQGFMTSALLDTNPSFPSHYPTLALEEIATRYIAPNLGLISTKDPGSASTNFDPKVLPDVLDQIADIHDYAISKGVHLTIVYWPRNEPPSPLVLGMKSDFLAFCEQRKITVLQPAESEPLKNGLPDYFIDSDHPNEKGYDAMARYVSEQVAFVE